MLMTIDRKILMRLDKEKLVDLLELTCYTMIRSSHSKVFIYLKSLKIISKEVIICVMK